MSNYKDRGECDWQILLHFTDYKVKKNTKPPLPSTRLASGLFISVTCDGRTGVGERKEGRISTLNTNTNSYVTQWKSCMKELGGTGGIHTLPIR